MMYKSNFVAVIKCNGNILRERNGAVYLPFGAEYSILLKNKDNRKALVEIEVDGRNVLNDHKLIMRGNETQEIKGFMRNMDKTNRFKFIHKTKEIQKYRGDRLDDGLVRITYQFEQGCEIMLDQRPWERIDFDTPTKFRGNFYSGVNHAFFTSCYGNTCKSSAPLADEGITVKGDNIDQSYTYGNVGTLESSSHTIVLHLKGLTKNKKQLDRPLTVKTKITCETCGRKNRSTNKFCYNCGTYLD